MNTQIDKELTPEQATLAADMLKLLSDPTRLKILWTLLHGEHSVNELASHLDAKPAAISQHLSKLRLAHLVKFRRDGNKLIYTTENSHVHNLIQEALSHAQHIITGAQHE